MQNLHTHEGTSKQAKKLTPCPNILEITTQNFGYPNGGQLSKFLDFIVKFPSNP
jgi:hypothetical protein